MKEEKTLPLDARAARCWRVGYRQEIGARKEQQDSYGVVSGLRDGEPALLAVLADGMGGMKNGGEFSRITVDWHREHFQAVLDAGLEPPMALLTLAEGANAEAHKIYDENRPGGTTLITALLLADCFYILSVGDSRISLFRKNTRTGRYIPLQLNREHVLGALLDERAWMGQISFEAAADNMYRQALISGVGDAHIRRVDLPESPTRFLRGDRLALMSDGIYRSVTDGEMSAYMDRDPADAADAIVRHILQKNVPQQDNMSIIIIERL